MRAEGEYFQMYTAQGSEREGDTRTFAWGLRKRESGRQGGKGSGIPRGWD